MITSNRSISRKEENARSVSQYFWKTASFLINRLRSNIDDEEIFKRENVLFKAGSVS